MLVRTPSFFDMYKAVKFMSQDTKEQDNLLVQWIDNFRNNPKFFSLIALEKKEVVGVLTGLIKISNKKVIFNLSMLFGTSEVREKLCKKAVTEIDPDVAIYTGQDQEFLESIGFVTVSYNMMWLKENNTDEVIDGNN